MCNENVKIHRFKGTAKKTSTFLVEGKKSTAEFTALRRQQGWDITL